MPVTGSKTMKTIALIAAGGCGSRFGASKPKQYETLAGLPILRHSALAFLTHPAIDRTYAIVRPQDLDLYQQAVGDLDLPPPIFAGAERQDSVRAGLEALLDDPPERVIVHDAARPLLSPDIIQATLDAVTPLQGAIAALKITDTIKRTDENGMIETTLERSRLWRAQTPQAFPYRPLLLAHRAAIGLSLPDDAALAERAGLAVRPLADSAYNLKITSREDLTLAEYLIRLKEPPLFPCTGSGFDVHAFGPGDHLMLGGVRIAHDRGLIGHSDADVLLHALTDALLGALALGDIGVHFPPSDPRWKGADSTQFLSHALELVKKRQARLCHVDLTVICERPKIGPHRAAIVDRLASLMPLPSSQISVKATTTEGLGFTGRSEGIAVQAIASLLSPLEERS